MKLSSHPPLSGTTVVVGHEVEIVVCIDLSTPEFEDLSMRRGREEVVCAIWHDNGTKDDWREEKMTRVDADEVDIFESSDCGHSLYFKHTLSTPKSLRPLSFTINYLLPGCPSKQWANSDFHTTDGIIIFRHSQFPSINQDITVSNSRDLESYFTLPPSSNITKLSRSTTFSPRSPTPYIYHFPIPVSRSSSTPGTITQPLAIPIKDLIISYFSLIKHGTAWIQPHHSTYRGPRDYEGFHPPRDSVLAVFQTYGGDVVVFLPLSWSEHTVYLKGSDSAREDVVLAVGRNDGSRSVEGYVVAVVAATVEEGVEEAVYWAKRITRDERQFEMLPEPPVETSQAVESDSWSDALKYCTWNSLGRELTSSRVVNAVNDLTSSGIEVQTVIIDDNWQSLDNNGRDSFGHRWTDFETDKSAFPNGLKGLVDDIKRRNKSVKHVAVWHGILGYWNGISPDGWIARNYKLRNVNRGDIYVVDKEDIGRFYDDFYNFLVKQGITAVKADTQCLLDERLPSADKGELFPAYLQAWRSAAAKYFGERAISCMSLVPQILFTNHLLDSTPKFTLRNSDDFFPHTPSSHPWHIFANAHNAVLTSRLKVEVDWDMFQTKHEWASYHAAARAISGGPIYVTDDVGSHDLSIVKKVTGRNQRGEMVALRPRGKARAVDFFDSFGEKKPLKIVGTAGVEGYEIKLLGTWDLDGGRERTDMVSLRQVVGRDKVVAMGEEVKKYAVFSHKSQQAKVLGVDGYIKTNVRKGDWDVSSISPIIPVRTDGGREEVGVAVFGLLEQIAGGAAIRDLKVAGAGSTVKIGVELKALGVLGIYTSYTNPNRYGRIRQVTLGGEDVPDRFITIEDRKGRDGREGDIRVDVEGAWKYLRLDGRWDLWVWIHLAA